MKDELTTEPSLRQILEAVVRITKSDWLKPHIDEFTEMYADYVKGYRGTEILAGISYYMATFGKVPMPDEIPPAIARVKKLGLEMPPLPMVQ